MISLIKRAYNTINNMKYLNAIINELQKENEVLRNDFLEIRNRWQSSEVELLKLRDKDTNNNIEITMLKAQLKVQA